MKNKLFYSIIWILIPFLFLSSFSRHNEKEGKQVTDEAGRIVIVPPGITSIVSLSPANTEILFAIGAGDMVTGVTEYCNFPSQAQKRSHIGGFADVNIEKIVELDPDLILASHFHISKIIPALENLGFTVVVINPDTVPGVFSSIEFVGTICDKEYEAGLLVADLRKKYNSVTDLVRKEKPVTVYWELSEDLWTIGKGSFIDDLITKAGGQNIARELNAPWLQLSSEYILNADPYIIFLADQPAGIKVEDMMKRPGWETLAAVKMGRIILVPLEINDKVSRAGPRVIEALEYISHQLHP